MTARGTLVAREVYFTSSRQERQMTNRDRDDQKEPSRETRRDRDMSGASYGATEREQTEDLRRRNPRGDADVANGGVSEDLEQDSDSPAD
jgi:hypothetical protein